MATKKISDTKEAVEKEFEEVQASSTYSLKGGYARIFALGEDNVKFIDKWLLDDKPAQQLARHIQVEWGLLCDIGERTLGKQLLRYSADILEIKRLARLSRKSKGFSNPKAEAMLASMEAKVDAVGMMGSLMLLQQDRVEKLYLKEKDMPLTFDRLNGEIRLLFDMAAKLTTLQMDLGILRKIDPKVRLQVELPEEIQKFNARVDATRALQKELANAFNYLTKGTVYDHETEESDDE